MKINPAQLMAAYEATGTFVREEGSATDRFQPIQEVFEDKKANADAVIMVYGVYNAGKSTLINTLLGREEAATDDIPLTDRVSAYRWSSYSILDTPGVDAPIEHEQVTNAQMLKADAIIFVVDPVGTAEEAKTLSVLMDLQEAGKQVFLVMNEKKPINEEEFIKLKNQIRERLQLMADERGLLHVLKNIPIVKINAKRALQGKLKNQPKLVELSGHPVFEKKLRDFLQGISPDDIYGSLKNQLVAFLNDYVVILNDRSKSDFVKKYDRLIRDIGTEKTKLRQDMGRELSRHKTNIYEKSKALMRSRPDDCQANIEKLLESAGKEVETHLNEKLAVFVNTVQDEIEELQATLPKVAHTGVARTAPKLGSVDASPVAEDMTDASTINPALLKGAIDQVATLAKPEHIIGSLQLVKSALPSLMKGIGKKTMEKWAATAMSKWIPYVGTAISAASLLFDLFSGDPEEKKLRQQAAEQQRAKERALQQMEDFARDISDGFETSMQGIAQSELETFFANVISQVDSMRQTFSDVDRENSRRLERLQEILQSAASA